MIEKTLVTRALGRDRGTMATLTEDAKLEELESFSNFDEKKQHEPKTPPNTPKISVFDEIVTGVKQFFGEVFQGFVKLNIYILKQLNN